MSVSAGTGNRYGHRPVARGLIIGWLIWSASLLGGVAVGAEGPDAELEPEANAGEPPAAEPLCPERIDEIRLRARLDLGRESGRIDPFLYGQSLETLGRGIEGGLWAELLEDRKFFRPPTAPGSPWVRLGGEIGWSFTRDVERPYAGVGSVKVTVTDRAQDEVHGIAQRGLPLEADRDYVGHVILAGRGMVKAHLEWGDQVGDRDVIRIRLNQENFGRYPLRFRPRTSTAAGVLSIGLESTGSIWIGGLSLMAADHREGLRADVVALLENLDTPIYRWPGGSALHGYDWRDAIGPRDLRPPRQQPSWGRVESNDFGIDEFLAFCRALGAQPLVVVDAGIGSPELAAALVQYCNGSVRTTWGRRRALHGHAEPYEVRWWAVGSGLPGDGQAEDMPLDQRLVRHREFVHAMRAMDDRIHLVAAGQPGPWNERILSEFADTLDLLSQRVSIPDDPGFELRASALPSALRGIARRHREFMENTPALRARPVPIALDGWNRWPAPGPGKSLDASGQEWPDAVATASGLHEMTRHPELYRMAHYAPMHAQAVGTIRASTTHVALTPAALPLGLYRRQFGSQGLRVEGDLEPLDVVAALTADRRQITIGIVNVANTRATLELELAGGSIAAHATRHRIGYANAPAINGPGNVVPAAVEETILDDFNPAQIELPPLSVTVYRAPVRR